MTDRVIRFDAAAHKVAHVLLPWFVADAERADEKTWLRLVAVGTHGHYVAPVPAGQGAVSLRVKASDNNGNKIEQTVLRAYGLR